MTSKATEQDARFAMTEVCDCRTWGHGIATPEQARKAPTECLPFLINSAAFIDANKNLKCDERNLNCGLWGLPISGQSMSQQGDR
jgi:hypothetical protein